MSDTTRQHNRIRRLASQVVEIAREPRMAAIKKRWADVNALRRPDRAPVWCRPVGCWADIIPDSALLCSDAALRQLEYSFLQTLHKRDIDDDTPVEDFVAVRAVFRVEPANTWGVDIRRRQPGVAGGAWAFDPPLKSERDFDRLRPPSFTYDADATRERIGRITDALGGVMPVRLEAGPLVNPGLGSAAAELRGLEQMMLDMADAPHLMHRLMAFLRDAALADIDRIEASGLLTPNNTGPMTCSDPIGDSAGPVTCRNLWCMENSQEFDAVSPAMWEEFCLNYQKAVFARFGLVGYGCCENLTHKIRGVLSIPNLRIFTCSAWTDLSKVLEAVGRNYCIMWRQKASAVVFPDDLTTIKSDLDAGARQLRGSYYQIVLRELETLAGHPRRLHDWSRLAKEAAERHA